MADQVKFVAEGGLFVPNNAANSTLNTTTFDKDVNILGDITSNGNVILGNTSGAVTVRGATANIIATTITLTGTNANISATATFNNPAAFKDTVTFDVSPVFVAGQVVNGSIVPFNNSYSVGNTSNFWENVYANNILIANGVLRISNTTANVLANNTTLALSNSTTNTVIVAGSITLGSATVNNTIYTATANNANNLGGVAASSYALQTFAANADNLSSGTVPAARLPVANATVNGAVRTVDSTSNTSTFGFAATPNSVKLAFDNGATAYTNAVSQATTLAGNAYTNAIAIAANATNLTSGTVPVARLPIANTTANGIVQLVDSTSNTGTTGFAATPNSVKLAFDNGTTAYTNAVSQATTLAGNAYTNAYNQAVSLAGTAYSNSVANTTAQLSAFVGTSNVVTLGTITSGTWNATTIAVSRGGTGVTTHTQGLVWANTTSNFVAATAAQVVGVIGSTNVANATFATTAGALTTTNGYQVNSLGVGTANGGVGEIRATNNITAFYSSDFRLKENIKNIDNALFKVEIINGVEFDWTDDYIKKAGGEDGYFVRKHDVGVIAQEIQSVLPEAVAKREDGLLAVKYERIVPLLIEAIKELDKKVKQLELQVNK